MAYPSMSLSPSFPLPVHVVMTLVLWALIPWETHGAVHIGIFKYRETSIRWSDVAIETAWSNRYPTSLDLHAYTISVNDTEQDILRTVNNVSCHGAVAFISTDACHQALISAYHLMSFPLLRINNSPMCQMSSSPGSRNIIPYPPAVSLTTVLRHIMRDGSFKDANVFYDEYSERDVGQIAPVLDSLYMLTEMFNVTSTANGSAHVTSHMKDAVRSNMIADLETTLNVLWLEEEKLVEVLDEFCRLGESFAYYSRWLAICTEASCERRLREAAAKLSLDNLSLLTIEGPVVSNETVQDAVFDIGDALGSLSTLEIDPNVTHTEQCTRTFNSTERNEFLDTLNDVIGGPSCLPYRLAVTSWTAEGQQTLADQAMCGQSGRSLLSVDLFIGEKYGLNGRHFNVSTIASSPFVMVDEINGTLHYKGMAMDMLMELANMLNFTYTLNLVPDQQFGSMNDDGNWTGMVGQLQRKEVDLVVASLSVTTGRDTVMDFVEYFFEYGAVLMKKPRQDENKWRVIVQPFSWQVWVCIVLSVPLAGLAVWALTRCAYRAYATADGDRRSPGLSARRTKDAFNRLPSAGWYTFGAVVTQGGSFLPKSLPGRAFVALWWGFSIVLLASYSGSLIAYLTISKTEVPFNTLEEMVAQDRYRWGVKAGTVYYNAFKAATGGVYKEIFDGIERFAQTDPDVLSKNYAVHYGKVREGDYATMTDRTPLLVEAISDETCSLTLMRQTFMPLPMGVGLQEGSPFKALFHGGITKLRQSGIIQIWQHKWWPKQACSGIPLPESHPITLVDTQSAFYLLMAGVVLAALILLGEAGWKCLAARRRQEERGGEPGQGQGQGQGQDGQGGGPGGRHSSVPTTAWNTDFWFKRRVLGDSRQETIANGIGRSDRGLANGVALLANGMDHRRRHVGHSEAVLSNGFA